VKIVATSPLVQSASVCGGTLNPPSAAVGSGLSMEGDQAGDSRKQISFFFLGVHGHICATYTLLYAQKRRKQIQQNHPDETNFHSDIFHSFVTNSIS